MLAIATPSLFTPSETFIRNHIRTIAPGATVLLCSEHANDEEFGCPVLSGIGNWPRPRNFAERIVSGLRYRWHAYIDPGLRNHQHRRAVSFLKDRRVTVVLAEYGPMGCLLMKVCREVGVPLYVHFHGYDASMLVRDWRQRRHYRKLFNSAEGVIAASRFLAETLKAIGCPAAKLHISPHGIDVSRFRQSVRSPGRIVAVGRLVEKKAPHLTIRAFARISSRFPDARLDIIGDGPLRDRCTAEIHQHGLRDRIFLHGVQDSERVAAIMQEASMFVQHSVTPPSGDVESFGVSLVEAMASCLPVVATRHNGFPETIEDGVTGILIAEQDVEGMAQAMAALLSDPARAAAMGAAGRARVLERFTIEHARLRLRTILGLK